MDERVRLAYTAIQLLTLTSNQGGGGANVCQVVIPGVICVVN